MQLMLLLSTLLAYYANASNQLATDCTPRKLKVCRTVVWLGSAFCPCKNGSLPSNGQHCPVPAKHLLPDENLQEGIQPIAETAAVMDRGSEAAYAVYSEDCEAFQPTVAEYQGASLKSRQLIWV